MNYLFVQRKGHVGHTEKVCVWHLDLGLPASSTGGNRQLFNPRVCSNLLQHPEWTKTPATTIDLHLNNLS